jgi:hypothetical protein
VRYPSGSVFGSGGGASCAAGFEGNEGVFGDELVDRDDCEPNLGEMLGLGEDGFEDFFLEKRPIFEMCNILQGGQLMGNEGRTRNNVGNTRKGMTM